MKLGLKSTASNAVFQSRISFESGVALRLPPHSKTQVRCDQLIESAPISTLQRFNASTHERAFTLMEVMIAIGVFCIGVFAILDVVATVLHGARLLDKPMVDAGVVASEIQTNSIIDGTSGDGDLSEYLGDPYRGYDYAYTINEVESNHLYQADIAVTSDGPGKPVVSKMSVLIYAPQSPAGRLDGGYMNTGH